MLKIAHLRSACGSVLFGALLASTHAHAESFSFDVFASQNSSATISNDITPPAVALNTGLSFVQGAALDVTASGSWNIGGGNPSFGPDGITTYGFGLPGILYGSLIAKVAATGDWDNGAGWFKVGSSFTGVAPSSGTLFFEFLDQDAANNSGFVTAVVDVPNAVVAVPEPGTYLLMALGLAALTFMARKGASRPS